jgi:HAD superfamily hydrolase (TIGR01549 family)
MREGETVKLITLDFEGTLVNFQWKLSEAVADVLAALAAAGAPAGILTGLNYAQIYNLVRESEEQWGFAPDRLIKLVDEVYDKFDLDAASRWESVEGLHETLAQLKKDFRLALVSNIGQKALAAVLNKLGLSQAFDLIVTRNEVIMLKPHPEGLLKAIAQAGVTPGDVLHVGDSLADLYAARKAGVKICIVLGGESDPQTLLKEEPELVVDKFCVLPARLAELAF